MGESPLSSRELVEQLWKNAALSREVQERTTLSELPLREHLLHGESLRYLNEHWDLRVDPVVVTGGSLSSLKRRVKRWLADFVMAQIQPLLDDERNFRANVVRVANALAQGHDTTAAEIREVATGIRTESERLTAEIALLHRLLEDRVRALEDLAGP